jgi:hypothetical protein
MFDGQVDTGINQDVEMPDDCLPSDVEVELQSWVRCVTSASYTIHPDIVPVVPEPQSDETHAVH